MKMPRNIQKELLLYYANDFSKHAPKETIPRIHMVWDSIPMQLAKENRKFVYRAIREGARAKDFELAIQCSAVCCRNIFKQVFQGLMNVFCIQIEREIGNI